MKPGSLNSARSFTKSLCLLVAVVFLTGGLFAGQALGKTGKEIDASADAALDRFYEHVKDGKEIVRKAEGILILPSVKKGALIIGGEYGRGAMRIGGKTVDYYSMTVGSIGLQIGGQARDIIIAFMSADGLKKFRDSKGWEAGVDGNVALVTLGTGGKAISSMGNDPIVAFVYDVKGLIADMSMNGAKFNKLDK